MKLKVYTVFDLKTGNFATPFFAQLDAIATRLFGDLINDPKSSFNKHPADYSLFVIGSYDDDLAELEKQKPLMLVQGAAVFIEPNPDQLIMPMLREMLANMQQRPVAEMPQAPIRRPRPAPEKKSESFLTKLGLR